eukprot:m.78425 g.78425  ORF g.78425 m.78425 type:complete len:72 (-) comp12533_c0_seq1:2120-2335(-)
MVMQCMDLEQKGTTVLDEEQQQHHCLCCCEQKTPIMKSRDEKQREKEVCVDTDYTTRHTRLQITQEIVQSM